MATTMYATRVEKGFIPDMRCDLEVMERYPVGSRVKLTITKGRSVKMHRLYWQILANFIEATGAGYNSDTLHEAIKLKLGYVTPVKMAGKTVEIPMSISFSKMDQAEFNEFFEKAVALIAEVGGYDPLQEGME